MALAAADKVLEELKRKRLAVLRNVAIEGSALVRLARQDELDERAKVVELASKVHRDGAAAQHIQHKERELPPRGLKAALQRTKLGRL